ncbi:MAG: hypothetical protein ACK481_06210 [Candidatus Melainabacteria bacterium]
MSTKNFIIYGSLISILSVYANFVGWRVMDFRNQSPRKPSGPSQYHK